MGLLADFRDAPVQEHGFASDHGEIHSLDGAPTDLFVEDDVAEVLYHGSSDQDDWDGEEAAIIRLHDGRLVAWETWWGPTGSGFSEDAYGGDAEVWFAAPENLDKLARQALSDSGRRLCGYTPDDDSGWDKPESPERTA